MNDEIPVGSPPAPPGRHAAPSGWYADPVGQGRERYWDGWQWTRNVRPASGARPVDPPSGPGPTALEPVSPTYAPPGPYGVGSYGAPGMAYRMVPATADGVPLAGWGWRVAAFIVDFFVIYALTQIIAAVTPLGDRIAAASNEVAAYLTEILTTGGEVDFVYALGLMNTPAMMILSVISVGLFIVYSGLMLQRRGATLGKMLFRLRVVPVDQGHAGPGLPTRTAWLRPVAKEALAVVSLVELVNYLFPLWDRRRQTLHDKIVRTQVVRDVQP